jgi:hypothetical protein
MASVYTVHHMVRQLADTMLQKHAVANFFVLFFHSLNIKQQRCKINLSEIQEVHYQKILKDHNGCGVEKSGCGVANLFLGATQPCGVQGS